MIVKCPKCGKEKRTYHKHFVCCGVKHSCAENDAFPKIIDDKKTQTSTAKSEEPQKEVGASEVKNNEASPSLTAQSPDPSVSAEKNHGLDAQSQKEEPKEKDEPLNSPSDSQNQDKELEIEDDVNIDNPEQHYKYRCVGCDAYFNELEEDSCPSCKKSDVDVEVLNG